MNKRVHSRFTLKKSENSTPEKLQSCYGKKSGEMLGVSENSVETKQQNTGEGGSMKSGKLMKKITASRNLTTSTSIKRPNPYGTHSSLRNPKSVKSCQETTKKNVKQRKQVNKRAEFLKAKALENKVKKLKSAEKKMNKPVTSEDEKYEKEKRKSEITGKLKHFRSAKSAKKVILYEEAGDVATDLRENPICNENNSKHDCSPGERSNKSYEMNLNTQDLTSEAPEDPSQLHYWDNMIKMADEELQKSNELVEIIRNMSAGNVDTETFLSEWKKQTFKEIAKIEISKSSENSRSNISDVNEEAKPKDLAISRNKYTLLEPIDFKQLTGKHSSTNLDLPGPVDIKCDTIPDEQKEDCYSLYSLPDEISETMLNLKERTSNEDFYLTSTEFQFNENWEDEELPEDEVVRVVNSNYQLSCTFCSDENISIDEDDVSANEKNEYEKDLMAGTSSESDEISRDLQCETYISETVKIVIDDVEKELDPSSDDDYEDNNLEDFEGHNSELNNREACLISTESEVIDDKPPDFDNEKCFKNELHVPRTCSTIYMDVVCLVDSDTRNEVLVDKSTSSFINIPGHEQISEEVIGNINSKVRNDLNEQCDILENHSEDVMKNENRNELNEQYEILENGSEDVMKNEIKNEAVLQRKELTTESEQFCRCHEEVFASVESKGDVHIGKHRSGLTISSVYSNQSSGALYEGDSVAPNPSCINLSHIGCSEVKHAIYLNTNVSISDDSLSMENISLEDNTSKQSVNTDIDECIECHEKYAEFYSSDESVKTHPSSLVASNTNINNESIATECINDEYLYMLLNEQFDEVMDGVTAGIEDFQVDEEDSVENILPLQHEMSNELEESSYKYGFNMKQTDVIETNVFVTETPVEKSSVGICSNLKEPYNFAGTPLTEGHWTNSVTILSDVDHLYEFSENKRSYASLQHDLADKLNPHVNLDDVSNSTIPISTIGHCVHVIRYSSLHGLIGFSAATFTIVVGVLYFWLSSYISVR